MALLGLLTLDARLSSARAADIQPPVHKAAPPVTWSWSGFYIGAAAGYRSTQADTAVTGFTRSDGITLATVCAAAAPVGGCMTGEPMNHTNFRFSPYVGFNWQAGSQWVLGLEADWGFAPDKTTTLTGLFYPSRAAVTGFGGDTFSVKTTWDASVRGRVGFLLVPSVMVYGTGGAAWLHVESTSNCIPPNCGGIQFNPTTITHSQTKSGWTAGGGVEAALGSNWTARAEYRYADFGTVTNVDVRTTIAPVTATTTYTLALKTHTAMFGLAYKFGPSLPVDAGTPVATPVHKAPVAALASWSGFYLGLGLGTRSTLTDTTVTGFTNLGIDLIAAVCPPLAPFGGCPLTAPLNDVAFRINPYAGVNWQVAPRWVLGLEADLGLANKQTTLNGMYYPTALFGTLSGLAPDTYKIKTTWDASARGRIGVLTVPSVMLYATGGAAWLHIETESNCNTFINCVPGAAGFNPATVTKSDNRIGWTVGGGLEAMLWSNWLARAEYRYADFGTITHTDTRVAGLGSQIVTYDIRVKTHTAMFGLAHKFDWSRPVVARY